MLKIVNIIPFSESGEFHQDSEPNLAVNPTNVDHMVATAFSPDIEGGPNAPIYVSTNGGNSWDLRKVVPGNGPLGTLDITVAFAQTGGTLYAGILSAIPDSDNLPNMQILRTPDLTSTTPMEVLVEREQGDQPWVVAGSQDVGGGVSHDRVFVGSNNKDSAFFDRTATVEVSQDAATAVPPAGFAATIQLEQRATQSLGDGSPIRIAIHPSGRIYAAFQHEDFGGTDIVVARDDNWGTNSFTDLKDTDGQIGKRVAIDLCAPKWSADWQEFEMGQQRLGYDLAIAVDPNDSKIVWLAWCDRVGANCVADTDYTLHVRRSTDRGATWSGDLQMADLKNIKNPALAVNANSVLGLAYQEHTGTTWDTKLELTADAWATAPTRLTLHTSPADKPPRDPPDAGHPYLGDYIRLLSVGTDFYGVFSGNNAPNAAHFPEGVNYQRCADWVNQMLLSTDGVTVVQPSIDPFFFHWSPTIDIDTSVLDPSDRPFSRWHNPIPQRHIVIPIIRRPVRDPRPIDSPKHEPPVHPASQTKAAARAKGTKKTKK